MNDDLEVMRRVFWIIGGITEFLLSDFRWYRRLRGGTWKHVCGPIPCECWVRVDDSHMPKAIAKEPK